VEILENDNGTWSHKFDATREWEDREACEVDLRFAKEWQATTLGWD
jgi:hypothetical protein